MLKMYNVDFLLAFILKIYYDALITIEKVLEQRRKIMGFYIDGPTLGKVDFIKKKYDGEIVSRPNNFNDIPPNKALICVVNNGFFEAAGFCFDEFELKSFLSPSDERPKTWMLIDLGKAMELTD
ncbi:MAG: hypothetical protein ACOCWG_05950 [bacterium]